MSDYEYIENEWEDEQFETAQIPERMNDVVQEFILFVKTTNPKERELIEDLEYFAKLFHEKLTNPAPRNDVA